jgi:hypothetical protein
LKLTCRRASLGWRIYGLPEQNDEEYLGVPVLQLEFQEPPQQRFP